MQNGFQKPSEMREFVVAPASYEIQLPVLDKRVTCEVSGEFILPDYLPEIKRLLRVTPKVNESSKYLGAGGVEFAGTVDYGVLYADNDGHLHATSLASDYDFECKSPEGELDVAPDDIFCDTEIESVSCRPIGPRKLVIKSRLCARVRAYNNGVIPERTVGAVTAEDEFSLERLRRVYPTAFVARAKGEEQYVEGEIALDGISGECKPIFSDAKVSVLDASCTGDSVSFRAQVHLRCLLETEDGELRVCTKLFPISDTIEINGAERGCDCRVWGRVVEVGASLDNADEGGAKLACNASVLFEAEIQKNISASLTEDAFSTRYACDCSMKEYGLSRALRSLCANVTFNHSLPIGNVMSSAAANIIDLAGEAKVDKVESAGAKCVASGTCKVSAVILDGAPESVEFDIPFTYEFDGNAGEVADFDAAAELVSVRGRVEGENIAIDGEVSMSVAVYGKNTVRVVDTLTLDKNSPYSDEVGASIVVCYPSTSDSLWSVAKRYHVPTAKIGKTDADVASCDSLAGSGYIIFEK